MYVIIYHMNKANHVTYLFETQFQGIIGFTLKFTNIDN